MKETRRMNIREYWLGLHLVPGLGSVSQQRLLQAFGSPENIFRVSEHELSKVENIGSKKAHMIKIFDIRSSVERELKLMSRKEINYITRDDTDYPNHLKNIFDAPNVLYIRGKWTAKDNYSISIVGSRKASLYGKVAAQRLAKDLAKEGITIISGMARGIDTIAHKGALSGKGRTVAVLGSGLDVIYPPENKNLMSKICQQGAVFSEFPLGTKPLRQNFPMRNRIIAGLSLGTVVIEAGIKSGALITAYQALDQGKEIFAVPGNINSLTSKGTNCLIKKGAKLVESITDIIEELQSKLKPLINISNPIKEKKEEIRTIAEDILLQHLSFEPQHIDALVAKSGISAQKISSILLQLEVDEIVKQLPGRMFIKL